MPKISIILPVYNVENYIAKSIESILNQTYKDFELLVIIDGSPDNSIEIAKSFQDDRIKIFANFKFSNTVYVNCIKDGYSYLLKKIIK